MWLEGRQLVARDCGLIHPVLVLRTLGEEDMAPAPIYCSAVGEMGPGGTEQVRSGYRDVLGEDRVVQAVRRRRALTELCWSSLTERQEHGCNWLLKKQRTWDTWTDCLNVKSYKQMPFCLEMSFLKK